MPHAALVVGRVVIGNMTNALGSHGVTSTHPMTVRVHRPGVAHLAGRQRTRLVIHRTTILRITMVGIVTNTKLPSGVAHPIPRTIIILLVRNTALTIFKLTTEVINTTELRRPIVQRIITLANSFIVTVEDTTSPVVAISPDTHSANKGRCG